MAQVGSFGPGWRLLMIACRKIEQCWFSRASKSVQPWVKPGLHFSSDRKSVQTENSPGNPADHSLYQQLIAEVPAPANSDTHRRLCVEILHRIPERQPVPEVGGTERGRLNHSGHSSYGSLPTETAPQ